MSYIGKGVETVTFNTATTLDVAGNITLGGTVDGRDVATDGTKLDTITSGAIANILQDTTPQLGGNLDLNTSNIIGTGNINVTGSITGTSFVSTGNMSFTNNSKAIFGTSPSLEIYHDGSNSILDDVGAGNFKMQLAGADKLEITSTGVDVTGTVTADGLTVDTSDQVIINHSGDGGGIRIASTNNTNTGSLRFGDAADNYIGAVEYNHSTDALSFYANNATRMTISSAGNVGIGTAPNNLLEVRGTSSGQQVLHLSNAAGASQGGAQNDIRVTAGGNTYWGDLNINAYNMKFSPQGSEAMRITSSGRVGIGTSSPTQELELKAASVPTFKLNQAGTYGAEIALRGNDLDIAGSANAIVFYTGGNNDVSTTERMRIDASGNVGIGAVPETTYVQKTTLRLSTTASLIAGTSYYPFPYYMANNLYYDASDNLKYIASSGGALLSVNAHTGGSFSFYTAPAGTSGAAATITEKLRIDTAGNVTIQPAGTTTRSFGETVAIKVDQGAPTRLSVRNDSVNATASSGITMSGSGNSWAVECGSSAKNGNALTFAVDATAGTPSVKMRLNTDGRWWVGQAVGTTLGGNGSEAVTGIMSASSTVNSYTVIQSNGSNAPLYVTNGPNRTGNNLIHLGDNGSYIGAIGDAGGRVYFADNTQNMGISFFQSSLLPTNTNGLAVDNTYDCGHSSYRWDDIWATNGTIQTSDANEKQQIAALTDVEMTAAKAISALFKTFKWNSAVEAKGDAARTHAGVIAQDVQAAMTVAGLDAGDYAFFISNTWWETQTEVPAVEAVDAVDAVYEDVVIPAVEEELDEDGNVIVEAQPERTEHRLVSEGIRAVEAVAAYTRTDVYDTAEEAPEGATERTRMGIRYPELLAFIGAATEQRLTTIEARIAALENT